FVECDFLDNWDLFFVSWVRCKPVGPRRGEGADGVGVFSLLQLGPRIQQWDPRAESWVPIMPQYGTRNPRVGSARPAIAIWKSGMCALGRRVLINAQIAVPLWGHVPR